jgi:hypothetical protein
VADPSPVAATTEAATISAVSNVVATSAIGTATFTAPSKGPTATFCATTTATIATTAAMVAAPTNTATQTPVATVHEEEWFHSDTTIKLKEVPFRQCKVKDMFGKDIYPGSSSSQSMSQLDFFLLMFPDNQCLP